MVSPGTSGDAALLTRLLLASSDEVGKAVPSWASGQLKRDGDDVAAPTSALKPVGGSYADHHRGMVMLHEAAFLDD